MAREHTVVTAKSAMGGSVLEVLGAAGTVVLAIIGLANVARQGTASAATIVVGGALMMEGGALLARTRAEHRTGARVQLGGPGVIALLGGAAGIVLGAFAIAGFMPETLLPIAMLVYGGTLLLTSIGTTRALEEGESEIVGAGRVASSFELLAGCVAITLGILALADLAPIVLSLIALLAVGAAVFMSGGAIGARMSRVVREGEYEGRRFDEPRTTHTHQYEVGHEPHRA